MASVAHRDSRGSVGGPRRRSLRARPVAYDGAAEGPVRGPFVSLAKEHP